MYEINDDYYMDYTMKSASHYEDYELYFKHQHNLAKGYANMKLGLDEFLDSLKEVENYVKEGYFVIQTEKFIQECFDNRIYTSGDLYYNTIELYHDAETLGNGFYQNKIHCNSVREIECDLKYALQDYFKNCTKETDKGFIENVVEMYDVDGVGILQEEKGYIDIAIELNENPYPFDYVTLGFNLNNNLLEEIYKENGYKFEQTDFDGYDDYEKTLEELDNDDIENAIYYLNEAKDDFVGYLSLAAETRQEILQICDEIGIEKEKETINRDDEER